MFTPHDWYWSGAPGIYGSARGGLVSAPSTDPAYVAWQALGNLPTPWPQNDSVAALDGVLATLSLPATGLAVPTVAQLAAYANAKAAALLAVSKSYTASGVTIDSDATAATLADWMALLQWAALNPAASTKWVANDNSVTVITATQIDAIAPLVGAYAQSVYGDLALVLTGIQAGTPTITTLAGVDAATWPA